MIDLKAADEKDYAAVCDLLEAAKLPTEGVEDHFETFVKLVDRNVLVGAAGLEVYGQKALLRSVVVSQDVRGRGYGRRLIDAIRTRAQKKGITELFLLTETAQDFFAHLGFEVIAREEADVEVRRSEEFESLCPDGAVCMRIKLG